MWRIWRLTPRDSTLLHVKKKEQFFYGKYLLKIYKLNWTNTSYITLDIILSEYWKVCYQISYNLFYLSYSYFIHTTCYFRDIWEWMNNQMLKLTSWIWVTVIIKNSKHLPKPHGQLRFCDNKTRLNVKLYTDCLTQQVKYRCKTDSTFQETVHLRLKDWNYISYNSQGRLNIHSLYKKEKL